MFISSYLSNTGIYSMEEIEKWKKKKSKILKPPVKYVCEHLTFPNLLGIRYIVLPSSVVYLFVVELLWDEHESSRRVADTERQERER